MEQRGGPAAPPTGWPPQGGQAPGASPHYQGPGGGAPAYPPPAYAQQTHPQATQTNLFAVLSLVSAILGIFVLPGIGSIIAIVFSFIARSELDKNPAQRGRELATWGLIVGIIGLVIWGMMMLFMMFMSLFFGGFGFWGPWYRGW